jgi:hypothetical protein
MFGSAPDTDSSVPATYHINPDDELISLTFTGQLDLVDVYELCRTLITDPDFRRHWPQLLDLRGIDIDIRPGAMRPFVNYLTHTFRTRIDGPMAVIFDGHQDDAFCAGVYRLTYSLPGAELFDDYAQGVKWLLANGWRQSGHPAPRKDPEHALVQQPDPRRNGTDNEPEQKRA